MRVAARAEQDMTQEMSQAPLAARLSESLGDPRPPSVAWLKAERRSTLETTDATLAQHHQRPEVSEVG